MTPHQTLKREARGWFVRLRDEDVSPGEIAQWQAWLARSPAHQAAYDAVALTWEAAASASAPRPMAEELRADDYDGQLPVAAWRRAPRRRWRAPAAMAAGLAAIVLTGAGFAWVGQAPAGQAITTARAEHKATALADGSNVAVGAMTGLQVRFTERRREIRVDSGEAYFEVAKDKSRPFVVATPFGSVTAVGTAFNVDVSETRMSLDVTEGVVLVEPHAPGLPPVLRGLGASPMRVAAGQRLLVEGGRISVSTRVEAAAASVTWPEGRLEYRGEPLRAVVEDVNRYASHPVVLHDEALGDLSYTGTVRLDAADDWASALPAAFPLRVKRSADGVVVLSAKM